MTSSKPPSPTGPLRTFVPSKDLATSRQFYQDLGFNIAWEENDLVCFRLGDGDPAPEFLLQRHYVKDWADNFMMHILVEDLDAWWIHLESLKLPERYEGVRLKAPEDYPWGLREVHLIDPAGVLWHIAQRPASTR